MATVTKMTQEEWSALFPAKERHARTQYDWSEFFTTGNYGIDLDPSDKIATIKMSVKKFVTKHNGTVKFLRMKNGDTTLRCVVTYPEVTK